MPGETATVEEASHLLGVSLSTIWRRIRSGELASVRRRGRRWVLRSALARPARARREVASLTPDHPIFRLVGAGRGGGSKPGARDKHALVDE